MKNDENINNKIENNTNNLKTVKRYDSVDKISRKGKNLNELNYNDCNLSENIIKEKKIDMINRIRPFSVRNKNNTKLPELKSEEGDEENAVSDIDSSLGEKSTIKKDYNANT